MIDHVLPNLIEVLAHLRDQLFRFGMFVLNFLEDIDRILFRIDALRRGSENILLFLEPL